MSVKVKKTLGYMAMAAFGLSLMACGSDVSQTENVDIDVKGNLFVSVRDVNGNMLSAADTSLKVTLLNSTNNKGALKSDSLGTTKYKDLAVGTYQVFVQKAGYASMVCDASIGLAATEEVPVASDKTVEVTLHKLGATLKGSATYTTATANNDVVSKANGAVMRLSLNDDGCYYVNSVYTAAVGTDGAYSFADLPELASATVQPQALTVGTILYTAAPKSVSLSVTGDVKVVDPISYTVEANPLVVTSSNVNTMSKTGSLVINFSEAVDVARIVRNSIQVKYGSTDVAYTAAWSNSNMTLTIASSTGKWDNDLSVTLNLYSTNAKNLYTTLNAELYADGALAVATGLGWSTKLGTGGKDSVVADAGTGSAKLKWNAVANASGYEIYRKTTSDSSYTWLTKTTDMRDTSASVTLTVTGGDSLVAGGDSVKYMVVAYNTVGRSDFATSPIVTIKDGYRPKVNSFPGYTIGSLAYTAGALPVDLAFRTFSFTEDMDTNSVPSIQLNTSAHADILAVTYKWTNAKTLQLTITMKANQKLTDAKVPSVSNTITVNLSTLKDVAGNLYLDAVTTSATYNFTYYAD